jgi:hypothetical protein
MPARRRILRAALAGVVSAALLFAAPDCGYAQNSSGGYSRPAAGAGGAGGGGAGDRAFSRGAASQALQQYRGMQQPSARRPSVAAPDAWPGTDRRRAPAYGTTPYAGGGGFDSMALWALLGALTASERATYAREHRDDPAYQQWRQQAQQQAARDPALAAELQTMDPQSAPAATPSGGGGIGWIVLFLAIGAFVLLWLRRRRAGARVPAPAAPPGLSGSDVERWRVGMTFPFDPAPFLLAAGTTKVRPPPESGMLSVEAIGLLSDASARLHRLYLPGRDAFFQIHLGPDGRPDECRYFSPLDEVTPADAAEWKLWLDPAEGMIGWPAFQTKDGKTYPRAWAPGGARIPPRPMQETMQTLEGTSERRLQLMLYAAPTGAPPPAPPHEYVLVAAVEVPNQAWVEIHVGIDVNPAALNLAPVPLQPARSAA